jgi:hypothetical protein
LKMNSVCGQNYVVRQCRGTNEERIAPGFPGCAQRVVGAPAPQTPLSLTSKVSPRAQLKQHKARKQRQSRPNYAIAWECTPVQGYGNR